MLIDFATTAKRRKFCLANSLLDSQMATWLTKREPWRTFATSDAVAQVGSTREGLVLVIR